MTRIDADRYPHTSAFLEGGGERGADCVIGIERYLSIVIAMVIIILAIITGLRGIP